MGATLKPEVPLTGYGPFELRLPDRPYYGPTPGNTPFQQFFGLKAVEQRESEDTPVPPDGVVGLLRRENEQILRMKEAEALRVFKLAMTRDAEDHADLLSQAQRLLTDVRDLDRSAFVPNILLIHTALEKQQLSLAINHLGRLVRFRPQVFVERPDVASYFADSEMLEEQMRAYIRIGDENPSIATYALQAYCAWVLGDQARARRALDRLAELHEDAEYIPGIALFEHAMAAALQD